MERELPFDALGLEQTNGRTTAVGLGKSELEGTRGIWGTRCSSAVGDGHCQSEGVG